MIDSNGGAGSFADGVPVGFGMALSMNKDAMDNYARMTEADKEKLIARSHNAKSKEEMEEIINSIM